MDLNNQFRHYTKAFPNQAASGVLGTAADLVNTSSWSLAQSTPSVLLTLPVPSVVLAATKLRLWLSNTGSTPVTIEGITIPIKGEAAFYFEGTTWALMGCATQMQTRFSPNDLLNGVVVGGAIPAQAEQFVIGDGNFANPLTLPVINQYNEPLTITSSAGFTSQIATTNQVAGAVAQNLITGGSITFVPSYAGWVPLNASVVNGHTKYAVRGTYAAPLTGAITVLPGDDLLIVGNNSTMAMPSSATYPGRQVTFKKVGTVGPATITGSFDGVNSSTLTLATNESATLRSDGATWIRLNGYP